jgi:hypothetical protein
MTTEIQSHYDEMRSHCHVYEYISVMPYEYISVMT